MQDPASNPLALRTLGAPPRRVRLLLRCSWFFLLPFAVVGVWILAAFIGNRMQTAREATLATLKSSGRATTAQVTSVWTPLRAMPKAADTKWMSYTYKVDGQS